MEFEISFYHHPPESYSRELDNKVASQEMPYGYVLPPPPADTNDYDTYQYESHKEYPRRHRGMR